MDIKRFQTRVATNSPNQSCTAMVVMASDFDRILAERDALQQLLNARDDEVENLRAKLAERDLLLERSSRLARGMVVHPWAVEFARLVADIERIGISANAEPSEPVEIDERAEFEMAFPRPHGSWTNPAFKAERDGWQARAVLEKKP